MSGQAQRTLNITGTRERQLLIIILEAMEKAIVGIEFI